MANALELVGVAEAAAARAASSHSSKRSNGEHSEAFVWRQPLMRPAGNEQQVSSALGYAILQRRTTTVVLQQPCI